MSLDHILLGILRDPAAGYDVKQHFEQVFNHFWSADLAQIYRALGKLEQNGLLTSRMERSERGPDRKVYRRTAAGGKELERWLRDGPVFGSEKFAYLAQVFFLGDLHDATTSEEFFSTLREELVTRLEALAVIEQRWRTETGFGFPDALNDQDFHAWLTLDMGLRKTRALVDWADNALVQLHARGKRKGEQS